MLVEHAWQIAREKAVLRKWRRVCSAVGVGVAHVVRSQPSRPNMFSMAIHVPGRAAAGFMIAFLLLAGAAGTVQAAPITYQLVPVGNAGNAHDTTGYGGVAYGYQIGRYDVTIGQYTAFLNAVAKTDTYALYSTSMATDRAVAGISRAGSSGSYTYSVINNGGDSANRPITYVTWWHSARFANWMANGQPTGAQTNATTENGAYALVGVDNGGVAPAKNITNPNTSAAPTFFIPTENEWYKAAYYSPVLNSGSGGYSKYATQSNADPGNIVGSGSNQANYKAGGIYSVTQVGGSIDPNQNYLTDVGAFTNSASFYGTFDQSGNVFQWNDLDGLPGSSRGLRGGDWTVQASALSSSFRVEFDPSYEDAITGFRLASPVAVPEPSTWAMGAGGLACVAGRAVRRRRAR